MISLLGHVCPTAERIVSAIQGSALYAGIKMETKGFIGGQKSENGRRRTVAKQAQSGHHTAEELRTKDSGRCRLTRKRSNSASAIPTTWSIL